MRNNNTQSDFNNQKKHRIADVSNYRRPIIGVLTEPLRGDMEKKDKSLFETIYQISEDKSYIPRAHVQFLEQSGLLVVPISYLDTDEEIVRMLGEVNAVYVAGDSHKAVANKRYQ